MQGPKVRIYRSASTWTQVLQEHFFKTEQNCFETSLKWSCWLQCKCEWWSTTRIQKSKWILHNYFPK